jgi:arabinan endo-1,5-alpha-L-arabinosidase
VPATRQQPYSVGKFARIYDPSDGESDRWYINDHCFARGRDGRWHLFGITHAEPDIEELAHYFNAPRDITPEHAEALQRRVRESARTARNEGRAWFDPHDEKCLAHATAQNLRGPWNKQSFALVADASESVLWAPHVVEHRGRHYMFYAAGNPLRDGSFKMHLATSMDLDSWVRHPANPLFIDGWEARDPMLLRLQQHWVMYYTATEPATGGHHVVAYRTSTDLVSWSARGIAFVDRVSGQGGGTTESPFVVQRGAHYYLFLSMRHGYVPGYYADTEVFRSDDPLRWRLDDLVGRIDSHAAEVIRDGEDAWYVSHCGWYQGGVYLAPLTWHDAEP